jgi:hypothetical protein
VIVAATLEPSELCHVVVDGHSGPSGGEHLSPPFVGFTEEDVAVSGVVESFVHASDAAEEGSDIHLFLLAVMV